MILENLEVEKKFTVNDKLCPSQSYFKDIYINDFTIRIEQWRRNSFFLPQRDAEFFTVEVNGKIEKLKQLNFEVEPYKIKEWIYKGKKFEKFDRRIDVASKVIYANNGYASIYFPKVSRNDLEELALQLQKI